jgi:hypothetical protein
MSSLLKFVFPPHQEHPNATGRLELLGRFGPCNEEGHLLGGKSGWHKHLDFEIRHMISNATREAFFSAIKRPREDIEALVDSLLPLALDTDQNMSRAEVERLLRGVRTDEDGNLDFGVVQKIVLQKQRKRLQTLLKDGVIKRGKEGPRYRFKVHSLRP